MIALPADTILQALRRLQNMSAPTAPRNSINSDNFERERAALVRLLASGVFDRSPSLAVFLRYVCGKYFEGKTDDIKEYNIAVEALGRPGDFDQKRDAIVRVEAHRLRKRLQTHFEGPGSNEPVHITIPPGTYAPKFIDVGGKAVSAQPDAPVDILPLPAETAWVPAMAQPNRRRWVWYVCAAIGIAIVAGVVFLRDNDRSAHAARIPQRVDTPVGTAGQEEVRILAGSTVSKYVDHLGNTWTGDRYFVGGSTASVASRPIARTLDPSIYLTRREGDFKYDIPLRPGTYEVRLHFAETIFGDNNIAGGGEASRLFSVRMNGQPILTATDILSDAGGGNVATLKVFRDVHPAQDGLLHLEFLPNYKEVAFLNAIEITPGLPNRLRPIRILARSSAFTDSNGGEWMPDHFFTGGQPVQRQDKVAGTPDQEIYQSERYGNFVYAVPVVEGSRYSVRLSFCEHWFGPGRPGGGGPGMRVFDVYLNGRAILENFDIFKEAGGSLRPIERTFRGLQPNAQGKLVLQFVPVRNYALVNAIEVTEDLK